MSLRAAGVRHGRYFEPSSDSETDMKRSVAHAASGLLLLLLVTGCGSGKAFEAPQAGEIPKGPGIFTKGDDGAVIYDSEGGGLIPPQTRDHTGPDAENSGSPSSIDEWEAFEAYRQWKAWKADPRNAEEVREFQEWREWKRYQQWRRSRSPQP